MKEAFSTFHPIVNFIYFMTVILFSMVFMHPIFLGIAFVSAFIYSVQLKGNIAVKFNLLYLLPMLVFMALLNPVFNHQGVTIIFYLDNGNPITLESILFGVTAACMFITVIIWFSCYNKVMTSDKIIYLFGKAVPSLSLILSMVLRFVPRYKVQLRTISNAQTCIGRDVSQGSLIEKAKNGIKILSIMTTWALENGIETADSMKARGYGLPNRTSFSQFRFDNRDKLAISVIAVLISIVILGAIIGQTTLRFFPSIEQIEVTPISVCVYFAYLVLCMLPVIINVLEEFKWKYIESRM